LNPLANAEPDAAPSVRHAPRVNVDITDVRRRNRRFEFRRHLRRVNIHPDVQVPNQVPCATYRRVRFACNLARVYFGTQFDRVGYLSDATRRAISGTRYLFACQTELSA
jgi:hypothetical protein